MINNLVGGTRTIPTLDKDTWRLIVRNFRPNTHNGAHDGTATGHGSCLLLLQPGSPRREQTTRSIHPTTSLRIPPNAAAATTASTAPAHVVPSRANAPFITTALNTRLLAAQLFVLAAADAPTVQAQLHQRATAGAHAPDVSRSHAPAASQTHHRAGHGQV